MVGLGGGGGRGGRGRAVLVWHGYLAKITELPQSLATITSSSRLIATGSFRESSGYYKHRKEASEKIANQTHFFAKGSKLYSLY